MLENAQSSNMYDGSPKAVRTNHGRSRKTTKTRTWRLERLMSMQNRASFDVSQTLRVLHQARHRHPGQNETKIKRAPHVGLTRVHTKCALGYPLPGEEMSTRQSPADWAKTTSQRYLHGWKTTSAARR